MVSRRVCTLGWSISALGCAPELSPEVVAHAKQAAEQVQCERVHATVDELVAGMQNETPTIRTEGSPGDPHVRTFARDYVLTAIATSGHAPWVSAHLDRHTPVENVLASVDGTGAGPGGAPADEVVQLTAHYDAWFTGADDNASGVATALEVLRVVGELAPSRTLELVFYDMEETGLDGSVAEWEARVGRPPELVVNLDGVAYTAPSQSAPPGFRLPDRGDFILALGNGPAADPTRWMAELSGELDGSAKMMGVWGPDGNDHPTTSDFHRSDHAHAWASGVPALFITDTANLRNPHYHQPTDLPDTLDRDFHCGVTRLIAGSVAAYLEAP